MLGGARAGRLAALSLSLGLSACVATVHDCAPLAANSLAWQQCRADAGEKQAQLQLGRRYEEGIGVKPDPSRAAALYRAAAAFNSGTIYVYSPPVGNAPGTVIPVTTGPAEQGLPEALYRLGVMHLDGRGVRFDYRRGLALIDKAAAAGFAPAVAKRDMLKKGPRV